MSEEQPGKKIETMRLEFITKYSDEDENQKIIQRINIMMRECFPLAEYEIKRKFH